VDELASGAATALAALAQLVENEPIEPSRMRQREGKSLQMHKRSRALYLTMIAVRELA
jgi:hypothetical protein